MIKFDKNCSKDFFGNILRMPIFCHFHSISIIFSHTEIPFLPHCLPLLLVYTTYSILLWLWGCQNLKNWNKIHQKNLLSYLHNLLLLLWCYYMCNAAVKTLLLLFVALLLKSIDFFYSSSSVEHEIIPYPPIIVWQTSWGAI